MKFLEVSATLYDMDEEGRRRAALYATMHVGRLGWSVQRLADEAGLDPQTVRAFITGERWPWAIKRQAIERALGLEPGTFELVARAGPPQEGDRVERAIQDSSLSRGDKAKLLSLYYDMLDEQQRREMMG